MAGQDIGLTQVFPHLYQGVVDPERPVTATNTINAVLDIHQKGEPNIFLKTLE